MEQGRAILIAGPTASGKSALAVRLAEQLRGTVINADSMAVYADLSILTGRPSAAEVERVPHRLYGHVDAAALYSVGHWLAEVADTIAIACAEGRVPIVVGGTGLYFKALTEGLSAIPAVPEAIRARVRAQAEGLSPADLHARLAARDPETAAQLRPSDPQRILRALEVFEASGRPLAAFQGSRLPALLPPGRFRGFVLATEREALRAAIDRRFDRMMKAGALDEVEALKARQLDPALPAMRALGVPPLMLHLAQGLPLDAAVAAAKTQTRAYAKRQITFARHQLRDFDWAEPDRAQAILTAEWGRKIDRIDTPSRNPGDQGGRT